MVYAPPTSAAMSLFLVQLEEIRITSVPTGGSGGEGALTDNITLSFGKVATHYVSQVRQRNDDTR